MLQNNLQFLFLYQNSLKRTRAGGGTGHDTRMTHATTAVAATVTVSVPEDSKVSSVCLPGELGVVQSSIFNKSDLCNEGFRVSQVTL